MFLRLYYCYIFVTNIVYTAKVKDSIIHMAKYENTQEGRESQQQRETPIDGKGYRHKAFTADDTSTTNTNTEVLSEPSPLNIRTGALQERYC